MRSPASARGRWAPTPSDAGTRLKAARLALLEKAGPSGPAFCRAMTAVADEALQQLFAEAGALADIALVAVGGYGRAELCPASDLDILLLHRGRRDIAAVAEALWYPLWDSGLTIGHGVRTPKEALALAAGDLDTATALLDVRLVAGDAAIADDLAARAAHQWRSGAGRWLPELHSRGGERHAVSGEVAFVLEPDLKDGRGGLRDVHALGWAARASDVVEGPVPDSPLAEAAETLLAVRVALHRVTGTRGERLALQEQDAVARTLGYPDADALMAAVARAGRTIAWESDDGWRRVLHPRPKRAKPDLPLAPGVVLRDGEVVLGPDADIDGDATLPLRAAAAAADAGVAIARTTLDRLAVGSPSMPDPWPPAARDALVALLGSGHAAIPLWEALDQAGLLERALPEWRGVSSRPQRNAYHRFTVDRHLCEAAAEAAKLTRRVHRPDLLLVGAWLHDIGKGFPGDHTEAGMDVVARVGPRLGFTKPEVDVLVDMVRHHLLLPDVATRRDVDDPRTVEQVAAAVGTRDLLELLAALTEADSLATGPSAWSAWKAGLVATLVDRAARLLDGGPAVTEPERAVSAEHAVLLAAGELHVAVAPAGGGAELTVVAPDRPGVFAKVAGALAVHGLDVRSASAGGDLGMALETFEVVPVLGEPPDWERVRADVERALVGRFAIEHRLADRARAYAGRRRALAARPAEVRVLVDNDASDTATVLEVRAPDGIGVLYRITRALADCELDIRTARVTTLGHEVVDAFYVTDATGAKVVDTEHLQEIERAVVAELRR